MGFGNYIRLLTTNVMIFKISDRLNLLVFIHKGLSGGDIGT